MRLPMQARSPRRLTPGNHTMTYALIALFVLTLTLAGVAALLAHVERSLHGLQITLTSFF